MERYEAYKDSGVEWIGEIPAGWEPIRLKHLALNRVTPAEANTGDYLGLENVQSWTMGICENGEPVTDIAGILYDGECVLFGKLRPYLAKVALPNTSGPCSSEFLVLMPSGLAREYLAYTLSSKLFVDEVNSLTYGVRMPRAGWDLVGNLRVPVPPAFAQRAIVDFLDAKTAEIDALVADCEREVELLREYRKAVISEAVTKGLDPNAPMKDSCIEWIGEVPSTWQLRRLKEFCKLQTGHTPSTLRPEYFDGDVEWYTPGDINNDIVASSNRKVSQLAVQDNQVPQYAPNSVLLVAIGGTAGKVGYVPWVSSSNQQITAITSTTNEPKWLFYSLLSMRQHLFDLAMFTTLPILNNDYLANFILAVPPRDEQLKVIAYLDAKTAEIDSLIETKQSMADKLREYRRSLISEAVTGKFKVPGAQGPAEGN